MRQYANTPTNFWTNTVGRQLRGAGMDVQMVALYLLSSPHSSYTSLYQLPVAYIAADTGLNHSQVRAALASIRDIGFARYDEDSEFVWVLEGAVWQIGKSLKPGDKRVPFIQKEFDALPEDCPYRADFFQKYGKAFHIRENAAKEPKPASFRAAAKLSPVAQSTSVESSDPVGEACMKNNLESLRALREEQGENSPRVDIQVSDAAQRVAKEHGVWIAAGALESARKSKDYAVQNWSYHIEEAFRRDI